MKKLDPDAIVRKNPHLDHASVDALKRFLVKVGPLVKTRYRLVPIGTHRVSVGMPDTPVGRPKRSRYYPGF